MAKQRFAIGLDAGAQSVKAVCLIVRGGAVEVIGYKAEEYAGEKQQGEAVKKVLDYAQNILKEHKKRRVTLIASVEGAHIFLRVFKLPGVKGARLARVIAYEARQQIPFPIDDVVWSYAQLRRVSPEETDVALGAVKKDIVEGFAERLSEYPPADIVPAVIGLNNLLNWAGYSRVFPLNGRAAMVIDLGAKTTNIIIIEDKSLWFRIIPIGGDAVTQAIAAENNISFADAEKLKKQSSIILEDSYAKGYSQKKISNCIIKSLTRLTGEIARSVEVYSSSFNSIGPAAIFMTGGGSGLGNIDGFFNKKFRMKVSRISVTEGYSVPGDADKGKFNNMFSVYAAAFGLGLYGLGIGRVKLSLLPYKMAERRARRMRIPYLISVAGMLLFAGIVLAGYNIQMSGIYRTAADRVRNEIDALNSNKKRFLELREKVRSTLYKMKSAENIKNARNFWLEALLELEEVTPRNIWLLGIETDAGKEDAGGDGDRYNAYTRGGANIRLRGRTTGTYNDVLAFLDVLNKDSYFVGNTGRVLSAKPPENGVRDFVIEIGIDMNNGRKD